MNNESYLKYRSWINMYESKKKETPPTAGEWLDDLEDTALRIPELENAVRELREVWEWASELYRTIITSDAEDDEEHEDAIDAVSIRLGDKLDVVSDQTRDIMKRLSK